MEGPDEVRNCISLGRSEGTWPLLMPRPGCGDSLGVWNTVVFLMPRPGCGDSLGVWNTVVFSNVRQKTLFSLSRYNFIDKGSGICIIFLKDQ